MTRVRRHPVVRPAWLGVWLGALAAGMPAHADQPDLCQAMCATDLRQCRQDAERQANLGHPINGSLIAGNRSATETWRLPGLAMQQPLPGEAADPQALEERLGDCEAASRACAQHCGGDGQSLQDAAPALPQ